MAAGAAVALGSLASSALGQATWIGASGNFSVNASWLGNSAPSLGTSAAPVNLTFYSGNAGSVTATENIGTPWVANNLTFSSNNVNGLTAGAGTTSQWLYQLSGSGATLTSSGLANASMANGSLSATYGGLVLDADVTFGGTGTGNLTLGFASTAAVTQTASHSITVSGGAPLRILRNLTFNGANTFDGGLILNGGTVQMGSSNGAGVFGAQGSTMTVNATGGTVNMANSNTACSLGTLQLTGDLHIIGSNSFTLTNGVTSAPTVLQGGGNLYINTASSGGITIGSVSNSYSGAVVIDQSDFGLSAANVAGAVILTSISGPGRLPEGSITGAASIDVRAGGLIKMSNSVGNALQNGDRVSDTAPVRLRTATFELDGPAAAGTNGYTPGNLTEKIGDLTGAGNNTIYIVPVASTNVQTTLEANSLSRGTERGTFNFRSNAATMGDGGTATRARFIVDTAIPGGDFIGGGGAAASQNINILPYAVGAVSVNDNGSSFVTYGGDGMRPLTSAEYAANNLAPSDPTSNVMLTASQGGPGSGSYATMNSLVLGKSGTTDASVTGSGTLRITSGAVLFAGTNGTANLPQGISNNLDFNQYDVDNNVTGSREAVIWTGCKNGPVILGQMFGSAGLTKAGNGFTGGNNVLTLAADNSGLTGPLTINSGFVQFNQALALPGTGQITINGAGTGLGGSASTGLSWAGPTPTTLTRDVAINTGTVTFRMNDNTQTTQPSFGNLTIAGTISGVGNVALQSQTISVPGEIYVSNTANTYTGTTIFGNGSGGNGSGNIHIAADGSTGVGGAWEMSGGTLVAGTDISNSRAVNFDATSGINTNGNSVTLNGPITSFSTWGSVTTGVGLNKSGAGTLTFTSAVNDFGGPVTVLGGTLLINGNLGPNSAAGGVIVNPGAVLGGSGTVYRNVQVYSTATATKGGGTLSPGNSPGILTIWGSLNMAAPVTSPATPAATLVMQLNGAAPGAGYDQIQTFLQNAMAVSPAAPTAQLALGDPAATPATQQTTLSLSLGFNPAPHSVFWLIINSNKYQDNLTADATHFKNVTTGSFAGLPEGSTFTLGTVGGITYTGTISYHGDYDTNNPSAGTGNDVVIYNVQGCSSADFNCDGDIGTDADIEAFFACVAGTCPAPPCANTADFNGDGDIGTDADIEAFFRVLGGGAC
jgi:autotransporter-associated beta strand protein